MSVINVDITSVKEKVQIIDTSIDDLTVLFDDLYKRMIGPDINFWTGKSLEKYKELVEDDQKKYKNYLDNIKSFSKGITDYITGLENIVKEIEAKNE